jgi:hypothetical protein
MIVDRLLLSLINIVAKGNLVTLPPGPVVEPLWLPDRWIVGSAKAWPPHASSSYGVQPSQPPVSWLLLPWA